MELPQHPFEVRIVIGGDDWEYVRRAAQQIADYIAERKPDACQMASGGAGGSHSVSTSTRDVTAAQFHEELEQWRQDRLPSKVVA